MPQIVSPTCIFTQTSLSSSRSYIAEKESRSGAFVLKMNALKLSEFLKPIANTYVSDIYELELLSSLFIKNFSLCCYQKQINIFTFTRN